MTSAALTPASAASARTGTPKPSSAKRRTAASRMRARVLRSSSGTERTFSRLNARSGRDKPRAADLERTTQTRYVANSAPPTTDDGRYQRQPFRFTDRITADGRDDWPAE